MNYRLHLPPISGVRESQVKLSSREVHPGSWEDTNFSGARAVNGPDLEHKHLNWNVVLGLGVALIVSVGVWVAVGVTFARLWR